MPGPSIPSLQTRVRNVESSQAAFQRQLEENRRENYRTRNRFRALKHIVDFQRCVAAKAADLRAAALKIGSAYAIAARRHQDALANTAKLKALEVQMIYSVLCVGATGLISWAALAAVRAADMAAKAKPLIQVADLTALQPKLLRTT